MPEESVIRIVLEGDSGDSGGGGRPGAFGSRRQPAQDANRPAVQAERAQSAFGQFSGSLDRLRSSLGGMLGGVIDKLLGVAAAIEKSIKPPPAPTRGAPAPPTPTTAAKPTVSLPPPKAPAYTPPPAPAPSVTEPSEIPTKIPAPPTATAAPTGTQTVLRAAKQTQVAQPARTMLAAQQPDFFPELLNTVPINSPVSPGGGLPRLPPVATPAPVPPAPLGFSGRTPPPRPPLNLTSPFGAGGGGGGNLGGIAKGLPLGSGMSMGAAGGIATAVLTLVYEIGKTIQKTINAVADSGGRLTAMMLSADTAPSKLIGETGSMVRSFGESLGVFGPVITNVGAFGQALGAVTQQLDGLAGRYGQFSPEIAQAQAIGDMRQVLGDLRRSQEAAPDLVTYINASSQLQQRAEDAKIRILNRVMPFVIRGMELFETYGLPAIESVVTVLTAILNAVTLGGAQSTRQLNSLQELLDELNRPEAQELPHNVVLRNDATDVFRFTRREGAG